MIKHMRTRMLPFCLTACVLLGGCASHHTGALSKAERYGLPGERRLLTAEGKRLHEPMNTAEEYERLGDINLQRDDLTAAFINYTRALQLEPARLSASYKTGRLLLYRGLTEEARREFEKILKRDPKHALAHEAMGRTYLLDNDNKKAIEYFQKALTVDSRLWEAHDLMGIAYDRQKQHLLAIDEYHVALSINPDTAAVYNNLGVSYYLMGDLDKAKEAFTAAIETGEEGSRVYNNLGLTLARQGNYLSAREAFKRAGNESAAQNNIGYMYLLDGKNREAATAFEKAIELRPAFYEMAHDNLKTASGAFQE